MKWFLILCCVTLAACANYPARSPCQRQNLDLVRQNADNLLYLEYMRKQAQGDDEWQSFAGTDEYQERLNELRSVNMDCGMVESPCAEASCGSSCGSGCEVYADKIASFQAELRRQKMMIQRLYSQILTISQTSSSCGSKYKVIIS
jgi:hypothetical protein